jgi:hypothetical protein
MRPAHATLAACFAIVVAACGSRVRGPSAPPDPSDARRLIEAALRAMEEARPDACAPQDDLFTMWTQLGHETRNTMATPAMELFARFLHDCPHRKSRLLYLRVMGGYKQPYVSGAINYEITIDCGPEGGAHRLLSASLPAPAWQVVLPWPPVCADSVELDYFVRISPWDGRSQQQSLPYYMIPDEGEVYVETITLDVNPIAPAR